MEQVSKTLGAVAQSYMADPQKLMDAQMQLWNSYTQLWQSTWAKILGQDTQPVAQPSRTDKRFKDKDWQENTIFDFLKQFYLISANWAQEVVKNAEGVDEHTTPQGALLCRADRQCALALQLRADQSGSAARHASTAMAPI